MQRHTRETSSPPSLLAPARVSILYLMLQVEVAPASSNSQPPSAALPFFLWQEAWSLLLLCFSTHSKHEIWLLLLFPRLIAYALGKSWFCLDRWLRRLCRAYPTELSQREEECPPSPGKQGERAREAVSKRQKEKQMKEDRQLQEQAR